MNIIKLFYLLLWGILFQLATVIRDNPIEDAEKILLLIKEAQDFCWSRVTK